MHRDNANGFSEVICVFWRQILTIILELSILLWPAPVLTAPSFCDIRGIIKDNLGNFSSISQQKYCNKLPWVCRLYHMHWILQIPGVPTLFKFSFINFFLRNRSVPQVFWQTQLKLNYQDVRQMLGICKNSVSQSINVLYQGILLIEKVTNTLHSLVLYFKCFCYLVKDQKTIHEWAFVVNIDSKETY